MIHTVFHNVAKFRSCIRDVIGYTVIVVESSDFRVVPCYYVFYFLFHQFAPQFRKPRLNPVFHLIFNGFIVFQSVFYSFCGYLEDNCTIETSDWYIELVTFGYVSFTD